MKKPAHPDDVARSKYVRSQRAKVKRREGDDFARLHAALGEAEDAMPVPPARLAACPDEALRRLWQADGWARYSGLVWTMEPVQLTTTRWANAPPGSAIARTALGDVFVLHDDAVSFLDARRGVVRGPFVGGAWLFFNSTLVEWTFRKTFLEESLVTRLCKRLGPLTHDTHYALRPRGVSSNVTHYELAPLSVASSRRAR